MLGIPFLTAAWWAAKALGLRAAVGRFFNAQSATAIGVSVAAVVVMIGLFVSGYWIVGRIEAGAVAGWQSKLMTSRLIASLRERKTQREADERTAVERQVLFEQIRETATHAATLEQELARLKDNPVSLRHAITKELRK